MLIAVANLSGVAATAVTGSVVVVRVNKHDTGSNERKSANTGKSVILKLERLRLVWQVDGNEHGDESNGVKQGPKATL